MLKEKNSHNVFYFFFEFLKKLLNKRSLFNKKILRILTTISVCCLVESEFNDPKFGTEFGDVTFRIGPQHYEKFKWKVFYLFFLKKNLFITIFYKIYYNSY